MRSRGATCPRVVGRRRASPAMASPVRVTPGRVTTIRRRHRCRPPARDPALLAGTPAGQASRASDLGGVAGAAHRTRTAGRSTRTCAEVHFTQRAAAPAACRSPARGTYNTGREPARPAATPSSSPARRLRAQPRTTGPRSRCPDGRTSPAAATRVTGPAAGRTTRRIDARRLRHGADHRRQRPRGPAGARLDRGICVAAVRPRRRRRSAPRISTRPGRLPLPRPARRRGYRVLFVPGCYRPSRYLQQWWHDTGSFRRSRLIRVRLGPRAVRGIDARLRRRRHDHRGQSAAAVRAGRYRESASIRRLAHRRRPAGTAATSSEGLSPGRYGVQFTPGCNNNGNYLGATYPHPDPWSAAGQTVRGINAALRPGGIMQRHG